MEKIHMIIKVSEYYDVYIDPEEIKNMYGKSEDDILDEAAYKAYCMYGNGDVLEPDDCDITVFDENYKERF